MAPRRKRPLRKTGPKKLSPVDIVIQETVARHAEDAKKEVERDEVLRLAVRARIANSLFQIVMKEFGNRSGNGLHLSEQNVAKHCEEFAKQIARTLGLEQPKKKKS